MNTHAFLKIKCTLKCTHPKQIIDDKSWIYWGKKKKKSGKKREREEKTKSRKKREREEKLTLGFAATLVYGWWEGGEIKSLFIIKYIYIYQLEALNSMGGKW